MAPYILWTAAIISIYVAVRIAISTLVLCKRMRWACSSTPVPRPWWGVMAHVPSQLVMSPSSRDLKPVWPPAQELCLAANQVLAVMAKSAQLAMVSQCPRCVAVSHHDARVGNYINAADCDASWFAPVHARRHTHRSICLHDCCSDMIISIHNSAHTCMLIHAKERRLDTLPMLVHSCILLLVHLVGQVRAH